MRWRGLSALLSVAVWLVPVGAGAKPCGDDVGGRDVPCACGDIVVSSVALDDDPVTQGACPGDGLTVWAPGASAGVTVDLRGRTLHGSGHGAGLWLLDGGWGGTYVVSSGGPAVIEGFQDGVRAHGDRAVALLDGVVAVASRRDGMRFEALDYAVQNVEVRGAGRDGFAFLGKRYRVQAARATGSHRYGYSVLGGDGIIGAPGAGAVAEGSGMAGFWVMGMGLQLLDCVATGGMKDGLHLMGMHFEVRGCTASGNAGTGITGDGMGWRFSGNQADDNGVHGITVEGMDVIDEGGNRGSGNRGVGLHVPVAQCVIGDRVCRP